VPSPKASERHCGGSSFPKVARTIVNDVPARPKPMRAPADASEQRRARGVRHQGEPGGEHQGAGAEHPHGSVAVGDDAGERLADAPQQVLQRERESEDVAAPVIGIRHRRQEEAQRRARPRTTSSRSGSRSRR